MSTLFVVVGMYIAFILAVIIAHAIIDIFED